MEFSAVTASSYDADALVPLLNEKAAEGWDVVSIISAGTNVVAYLQRATPGDAVVDDVAAEQAIAEAMGVEAVAEQAIADAMVQEAAAEEVIAEAMVVEAVAEGAIADAKLGEAVAEDAIADAKLDEAIAEEVIADAKLEEALALFEEGVRLAKVGTQRLDDAERKLEILRDDNRVEAFEAGES